LGHDLIPHGCDASVRVVRVAVLVLPVNVQDAAGFVEEVTGGILRTIRPVERSTSSKIRPNPDTIVSN
jgi:hypothetical protein